MESSDARAGSSADPQRVESERRKLRSLAYRLLGTRTDVEDAVQETYLRWYRLSDAERAGIQIPAAWCTTTMVRICLDHLGSAKTRREVYVGEWLPEPIREIADWDEGRATAPGAGPDLSRADERLLLSDSVSMALMVVLEKMSPSERVSFILHDVFQFSFGEIADIVGRTSQACRQAASAGRKRLQQDNQFHVSRDEHQRLNTAFKEAWERGSVDELIAVLDKNAKAVVDGGGRVSAFAAPFSGAEPIARMLVEVFDRQPDLRLREAPVNGTPGLLGEVGGKTISVISTAMRGGRIAELWVMRNPNKLTDWQ